MKTRSIIILGLFSIVILLFSLFVSCKAQQDQNKKFDTGIRGSAKYEQDWKVADSLINKGLPKSALEVVNNIYTKAKNDNNPPQIIKASLYEVKLSADFEENSLKKTIEKLNSEISTSTFPTKQILHSMLAQVYWKYYQTNRYKFHDRSETINIKLKDIDTWDLKKIVTEVINNYTASLENSSKLKKEPLNIYDAILELQGGSKKFRPTLYDFLAHRAVDFFMNDETSLSRPADKFELDKDEYFDAANKFVQLNLSTKDSLSLKFYALDILQELLAFHYKDKNPQAFIDADLKRLLFVKNNSIVHKKDSLYLYALKSMEKKYTDDPASADILYALAKQYLLLGQYYKPLESDKHKWDFKNAFSYCQTAISRFPKSDGANNCMLLQDQIRKTNLNITTDHANLPDKPFLALISYKNISKIYLRLIKIDPEQDRILREKYRNKDLVSRYLQMEAVTEWNQQLISDGDFQTHKVEVKIPAALKGYYVLLAATNENFSYENSSIAYSSFCISNISFISQRNFDGSYSYHVLNRESGLPMNKVNAQVYYKEYDYTIREYKVIKWDNFITDKDGFFKISSIPPGRMSKSYFIDFTYQDDQYITPNYFYMSVKKPGSTPKMTRSFFYTDRAIYRPGQTIYFKGILLEKDGGSFEILPKHNTTVTFYDVNGKTISTLDLISNEYGSFSGSFSAPHGVLTGRMRIADHNGSKTIQVEEYKRPKFEVGFKALEGTYKLGENVNVTGYAKAYSGNNIDQAKVSYRVVRQTHYPYRGWWWRGYFPTSPKIEIINGTTQTDKNGNFTITFNAVPDLGVSKQYKPVFNYMVNADVTDINGETHSSSTNITVGYTALLIDTDIPGMLDKDGKSKFNISSTNLNGVHEDSDLAVKIYKLSVPDRIFRTRMWQRPDLHIINKEEFYSLFPNDQYDNEKSVLTWEREKTVYDVSISTSTDTVFLPENLSSWENGHYVIELKATDKYGEGVESIKHFTLFSKTGTTIPDNSIEWFTIIKGSGEPGEKASFLIGSKTKNVSVVYEIEQKGKIIHKEWIKLNDQQKLIEIPIKEEYRGNVSFTLSFVKFNRSFSIQKNIIIPYTNKKLDITFETFRNKLLPGQKEEWKIKIKDKKGDKVAAEMLAAMYDASLDAFAPNKWAFNIYTSYFYALHWDTKSAFNTSSSSLFKIKEKTKYKLIHRQYDQLNWFGFGNFGRNYLRGYGIDVEMPMQMDGIQAKAAGVVKGEKSSMDFAFEETVEITEQGIPHEPQKPANDISEIQIRRNFQETAFFYPQLETNKNGEVIIKFTVPESLTKWKMMGFAYSKNLKYGIIEKELVTQKDLMVIPNAPRFFREGDTLFFTAKVSNLSKEDLSGDAKLELYDAISMKSVDGLLQNNSQTKSFTVTKGQSDMISWRIIIPNYGINAITYRITARSGNFSDGEEMALPVLTNRMLVTESLPLPVSGKETKTFKLTKLINSGNSKTLKNHKLTLEYSSNPAWYAIQALPYLMEYPYECSEQIFSRYYANSIASFIVNSNPKVKRVFESWQNFTPDALLSNLEKNQELKSLLLEETPWVLNAKNETERKQRIALLFDMNKMSDELSIAINQLYKMQSPNGGWPWFKGMRDSRYITQHIVTGFGHLQNLGIISINNNDKVNKMMQKAVRYLDDRIREDYDRILKSHPDDLESKYISQIQIQYLYARSYFIQDISVARNNTTAFEYFKGQASKYWLENNKYLQGMIALGLKRFGDNNISIDIINSIKEHALYSDEMGMYWRDSNIGYYWYQAPIETHALLIEAFDEVAGDKESVEKMKIWLLKQKQTQDWKTTKATVEAVYALLLRGTNWLASEELVEITLGNTKIDPEKIDDLKIEAGTGYFKTSWSGGDIKPDMGNVTVTKQDEGVAWGALYWQYFEQLDKISTHETPLQLQKKLFVERNTSSGPVIEEVNESTTLNTGDKVKVRIELRVDRDMEYVHMKDMRASAFEPVNVISSYKYQGGLGYYESTRDAATNFFISYLRKGTYVFEYPLVVSQRGNFSNGITTIQCMYAPEFGAHSEGIRVKVGE